MSFIKNYLKKTNSIFVIFLLILFLSINNFFYNIYYLVKNNYSERMNYHYGKCYHSGYGFIKAVYKKFNLSKNVKIINYLEKPSSEWFIYKPKVNYYLDKIILLNAFNLNKSKNEILNVNYKGKFLGKYKILHQHENCFFLEKLND